MRRRSLFRMDLPQALGLALLVHLLLFLGGEVRPDLMPWANAGEIPEEPPPLRFEFVDLAQEPPVPETPPENAPASDRTRRAATPEPPAPVPESPDPFSQGDTSEKILRPTAPESTPQPVPPAEPVPEPEPEPVEPEPQPREEPREEAATNQEPSEVSPEPRDPEPVTEGPGPREPEERSPGEDDRKAQAILDATKPFSMRELGQRYDNVGAPSNADFGTVSFDTVGVDWGPYAKQIVEIIRRQWIDRLPPAFEAGLKGRSVLSFRIAKDGTVTVVSLESGSGVRPFDKAAEFAIRSSSPLPPLPPAFLALDKEDVGVTFEFYYNLRPPPR